VVSELSTLVVAPNPIAVQNKVVLMVSSAANAINEGDTQGYVWRFQTKATDGRKVVDSLIYNPEQPSYRAEVERVGARIIKGGKSQFRQFLEYGSPEKAGGQIDVLGSAVEQKRPAESASIEAGSGYPITGHLP